MNMRVTTHKYNYFLACKEDNCERPVEIGSGGGFCHEHQPQPVISDNDPQEEDCCFFD